MATIQVSTIDEKFLLDEKMITSNRESFRQNKTAADSFGSIGDIEEDQALIIVNPCEYTLEEYMAPNFHLDNPYPQEIDEESQYQVQKGLFMGFREPE